MPSLWDALSIVEFCPVTYISFTKLPINIKPSQLRLSSSVGKTQIKLFKSHGLSVCISLNTAVQPKNIVCLNMYLSCSVTDVFNVDYWRDLEAWV